MITCQICGKEIEYDEGEYDGELYTCYKCLYIKTNSKSDSKKKIYCDRCKRELDLKEKKA